jgi:hypothetical protein
MGCLLRQQIVELAPHNTVPTMYAFRQFAESGGLMSYRNLMEVYRQVGVEHAVSRTLALLAAAGAARDFEIPPDMRTPEAVRPFAIGSTSA